MGPTPGWSSSWGAAALMSGRIAASSWSVSSVSVLIRRGDRPQGRFGGGELLVGGLWRSEGAALGDHGCCGGAPELVAQIDGSGDEQGLELADGCDPRPLGTPAGGVEHSQRLAPASGARDARLALAQHLARGAAGVEGVGLGAVAGRC